jgi:IclR family transcriptional regulator, mhp operon transcriptional activator
MLFSSTLISSRESVSLTEEKGGEGEYIRAAERTLQILACMNRRPISTIQDLHDDTGLPKPTLVRFLKTMARAGYVTNDQRQAGYQLTSLVSSLSSGYHGDPLVIEAGRPWAIQITRQLHWPVSIAVLDVESVVVRFSTVADSPVSPFHSTINMHLNLFTKALGRAYLAYCEDDQIEAFAQVAERSDDPTAAEIVRDRAYLRSLLKSIRRAGYALRDNRAEPKNSNTLAVPIFLSDRVRATLGMTFFRSAIKSPDLIREYAEKLKQVSAQITADTERLRSIYGREKLPATV